MCNKRKRVLQSGREHYKLGINVYGPYKYVYCAYCVRNLCVNRRYDGRAVLNRERSLSICWAGAEKLV